MQDIFQDLIESRVHHALFWSDKASGLKAVVVFDALVAGRPAAGGVRCQPYPTMQDALLDAARLARAMTLKCGVAQLDVSGGKIVVLEHPAMKRAEAFAELGRRVEELGGLFHTGGDLGTRAADLKEMARHTAYVHTESSTAAAVAQGVVRCMRACARLKDFGSLSSAKVAIQGCGVVGHAVAQALSSLGAQIFVADVDSARALAVANEFGATVLDPTEVYAADVDILCPCATGGVLTLPRVASMKAWAVCGGANNVLASRRVAQAMKERGVLFVPDFISSAGGVIDGLADTAAEKIESLGMLAERVLREEASGDDTGFNIAERIAMERVEARTAQGSS